MSGETQARRRKDKRKKKGRAEAQGADQWQDDLQLAAHDDDQFYVEPDSVSDDGTGDEELKEHPEGGSSCLTVLVFLVLLGGVGVLVGLVYVQSQGIAHVDTPAQPRAAPLVETVVETIIQEEAPPPADAQEAGSAAAGPRPPLPDPGGTAPRDERDNLNLSPRYRANMAELEANRERVDAALRDLGARLPPPSGEAPLDRRERAAESAGGGGDGDGSGVAGSAQDGDELDFALEYLEQPYRKEKAWVTGETTTKEMDSDTAAAEGPSPAAAVTRADTAVPAAAPAAGPAVAAASAATVPAAPAPEGESRPAGHPEVKPAPSAPVPAPAPDDGVQTVTVTVDQYEVHHVDVLEQAVVQPVVQHQEVVEPVVEKQVVVEQQQVEQQQPTVQVVEELQTVVEVVQQPVVVTEEVLHTSEEAVPVLQTVVEVVAVAEDGREEIVSAEVQGEVSAGQVQDGRQDGQQAATETGLEAGGSPEEEVDSAPAPPESPEEATEGGEAPVEVVEQVIEEHVVYVDAPPDEQQVVYVPAPESEGIQLEGSEPQLAEQYVQMEASPAAAAPLAAEQVVMEEKEVRVRQVVKQTTDDDGNVREEVVSEEVLEEGAEEPVTDQAGEPKQQPEQKQEESASPADDVADATPPAAEDAAPPPPQEEEEAAEAAVEVEDEQPQKEEVAIPAVKEPATPQKPATEPAGDTARSSRVPVDTKHDKPVEKPVSEQKVEESVKVEKPKEPVKVEKPKEPVKVEKPKEPVKVEQPKEPVKAEKPKDPVKEEKPKEPVKEEKPKQPVKEEKPVKEKPVEEEKPKEPVKVEKSKEQVKEGKPEPVKVEKPKESVKKQEPEKEKTAEKPAEKPVQSEKPPQGGKDKPKPTEAPVKKETPTEKPVKRETLAEKPVQKETPAEKPVKKEEPTAKPVRAEAPTKKPAPKTGVKEEAEINRVQAGKQESAKKADTRDKPAADKSAADKDRAAKTPDARAEPAAKRETDKHAKQPNKPAPPAADEGIVADLEEEEPQPDADDYEKAEVTGPEDWDIREELDSADNLVDTDAAAALNAFGAILSRRPRSPRALWGRARALNAQAAQERSNNVLDKAIKAFRDVLDLDLDPATPVPLDLYRQAAETCVQQMRFRGLTEQAARIQQRLIQKFPDDYQLRNHLATVFLAYGQNDAAEEVLDEVLRLWPNNGYAKAHLGFIRRQQARHEEATRLMQEGLDSDEPGVHDKRFYYNLGDSYDRIGRRDLALKTYEEGVRRGLLLSTLQRSLINVDRLTGRPFWTPEQTGSAELIRELEANFQTIRGEMVSLLASERPEDGFQPEQEQLSKTGDWKQYTMFKRGRKNQYACAKTPRTCELIGRFPEAAGCRRGQVKFSMLAPGTTIWPHTGPTNCRLRIHLGLKVPNGTGIRVAGEKRTWEEGKVMIIDDSFEHDVWNEGDQPRFILIVDIWHPELTEEEKRSIPSI